MTPFPLAPELPPRPNRPDGTPRRVGVEIEFSGIDAAQTADIIRDLYGGTIEEVDPHWYRVRDTRLGDFTVELDVRSAHPEPGGPPPDQPKGLADVVGDRLRTILGDIASVVMPYEVVTPPITIARLADLDMLVEALGRHGARGTRANPLYSFGLHLNPEVAAQDCDYILDHLRAYVLLAPWLRARLGVDLTRRLMLYIERFPDDYAARIVDPGYRPDLAGLVTDYVAANPSRDRELDLYPLFAYVAADALRACFDDPSMKIRPRPTFHYRLPDSRVGEPGWSIVPDWNLWVEVERLAADPERLAEMGQAFREHAAAGTLDNWHQEARRWIVR